jgi:hypothetical protein
MSKPRKLSRWWMSKLPLAATGGKIVVADQIYRGRFLFASKNCGKKQKHRFRYSVSRTATEEK